MHTGGIGGKEANRNYTRGLLEKGHSFHLRDTELPHTMAVLLAQRAQNAVYPFGRNDHLWHEFEENVVVAACCRLGWRWLVVSGLMTGQSAKGRTGWVLAWKRGSRMASSSALRALVNTFSPS